MVNQRVRSDGHKAADFILLLFDRLHQAVKLLVHGESIIEIGRKGASDGAGSDESAAACM